MNASHQFQLHEIFDHSVRTVKDLKLHIQPLERLVLGDKFAIEDWTASAFDDLLARKAALTLEEVMALGFDRFVRFMEIRGERLSQEVLSFQLEERHLETGVKKKRKSRLPSVGQPAAPARAYY